MEDLDRTRLVAADALTAPRRARSGGDAGPIGPAGPGNALPPGTRLGEFEITGLIGEGGFGIVYGARDLLLQRSVAIKEYMPGALASRLDGLRVAVKSERHAETFHAGLRSFVNEAQLLARFDHPSLVKVYRFWEANGTAYMVMPCYQGVTLREALRRRGAPDERWLRAFLAQLLDALDTIHAGQCCHRDIAPDNILLLADDRPLLLDFGAARRVIGDMTQALTVILKPGFAPLEQYAETPGARQGPWTDLYALAAVVHYAITGRAPVASVARIMNDSLQPLSQTAADRFSPSFLRAIDHALAVRPEARTQSVAEMIADLVTADSAAPAGSTAALAVASAASEASATAPYGLSGRESVTSPVLGHPGPTEPALCASESIHVDPVPPARPAAGGRQPRRAVGITAAVAVVAIGTLAIWLGQRPDAATPPRAAAPAPDAPTALAAPAPAAPAADPPATGSITPAAATAALPDATLQAVSPAPGRHDAQALLEALHAGRDPSWRVSVQVDRPTLRIGRDRAALRVESGTDGHLYLLMLGSDGRAVSQVFPNALDADNRIAAGRTLALPRAGWSMRASGPAGTDRLVAIVSKTPRDFLARPAAPCAGDGDCGRYGATRFEIVEVAAAVPPQRPHQAATAE